MNISVVIPVFHEEALINEAISRLGNLPYKGTIEIIVVDGSTEAETLKAITNRNVKCLQAPKGRAKQMNAGTAAACGDIVLFLHVDTELPEDGLKRISRTMADKQLVAGAFDLGIADKNLVFRIIERVASLRSRLTRIPYGDQAIFFKRSYFLQIGGYNELPIMEDVDLMRRVKKKGDRISFVDKKVLTSSRRLRKEGVVFCTMRNWTIMFLYLLGVSPERLVKWYT